MIKSPHIETLLVSQTAHKEVFISGAGELCISELITENGKPVSFEIRKIETVDDLLPAGSEKE